MVGRRSVYGCGCALALALSASAPSARAGEPRETKVTAPQLSTVVLVTDESDQATASAVAPAVRAQLSDLPVTLVPVSERLPGDLGARMRFAARVADERGGQAVFWLEVEASGSVLYFTAKPYSELLSRRLGESARGAALDEEVAVIVRSTVVALLQNEKIDMARVEPPSPPALAPAAPAARPRRREPPPKTEPAAPPPEPERFRISAGYVGTSFSEVSGWEHGAAFGVAGFPWSRLLVGARYSVLLPVAVDSDAASLRIYRHPFEATLAVSFDLAPLYLEPEIAALFDYRTRSTTATSSDVEKTPDSSKSAFGVSPRARAVFRLYPVFSLFATVGVDFYSPQVSYLVRDPEEHEILRSRTILPRVEAGLNLNPF